MNEIVELIVFNILTSAALWTKLVDNKGAGNLKRTIEVYTDSRYTYFTKRHISVEQQ